MYPNYTKTFLNLEGVYIKKVVQADSFIEIFIQSHPTKQICPCCGAHMKRVHDYRLQQVRDMRFRENRSPWSFVTGAISALSATNVLRNPARSCLAITAGHADLHSTSFPCFVRPFP